MIYNPNSHTTQSFGNKKIKFDGLSDVPQEYVWTSFMLIFDENCQVSKWGRCLMKS